jgi:hypothetical protein
VGGSAERLHAAVTAWFGKKPQLSMVLANLKENSDFQRLKLAKWCKINEENPENKN